MKNRILILGASGYLGNSLYKELQPYFDVYGTYCNDDTISKQNKVLFKFNFETDSLAPILQKTRPNIIISSLRGDASALLQLHRFIAKYLVENNNCKLLFLSTAHVFDGKFKFPSYEGDATLAESAHGKLNISLEKILQELPVDKYVILRIPTVLGLNSPALIQLKQQIKHQVPVEVYPNLIISITTARKIAQQVHYIINQKKAGIFHLASSDMIHHEDLYKELIEKLQYKMPVFKNVFNRNEDSYLAILPLLNLLPKEYRITVAEVIEECTLNEEISTLKI